MNKRFFIYLILNIIIWTGFAYIGYSNSQLLLIENPKINHIELFYIITSTAVISVVFGMFIMAFKGLKQGKTIKEYKRELERRGIDNNENASRVKVLESKIEVLEKALESSLKNKDN